MPPDDEVDSRLSEDVSNIIMMLRTKSASVKKKHNPVDMSIVDEGGFDVHVLHTNKLPVKQTSCCLKGNGLQILFNSAVVSRLLDIGNLWCSQTSPPFV